MAEAWALKFRAKPPFWEPLIMGRVGLRVLPKASGEDTPGTQAGPPPPLPPQAALGPTVLFPLSPSHFLLSPAALAGTLPWKAVSD